MITRLSLLVLAVAIAVIVSACGSDDNGDTTSDGNAPAGQSTTADEVAGTPTPDKDEFIKKANSICGRGKQQGLNEMGQYVKARRGSSAQANAELLVDAIQSVFLPKVQDQIDEIRALGLPAGDEEQVEAFLAAMQQAVDTASDGSPSDAQFGQSFQSSAQLAREYGLNACAYG